MTEGIDVSSYQGEIDFNKVKKSGAEFVILRAGWGDKASNKDAYFEKNYKAAKKAGLFVGAYWYSYAESTAASAKEAAACKSALKNKQFEFPVFYDVEEPSQFAKGRDFVTNIINTFCAELENSGYMAGLYISRAPLESYVSPCTANKYALWIAEYGKKLNYRGNYGMWQYTGSGRADGVKTVVDKNYCYTDYPSIIKNAGLNGFGEKFPEMKPVNEIALEVIRGDWGNGEERKRRLTEAGYDYYEVQREVQRILDS